MADDGRNTEESSGELPALQVRYEREGDVCRVKVIGDVDLATTSGLRQGVEAAVADRERFRSLVIDLRQVEFMDSAGLALLVEIRNRYGADTPVGLVVLQRSQPERILRLGHFEQFFRVDFMPPEVS